MKFWVARDMDGQLWLYGDKPNCRGTYYELQYDALNICNKLDDELFPEVTFENSPQMVEIKLVKEE